MKKIDAEPTESYVVTHSKYAQVKKDENDRLPSGNLEFVDGLPRSIQTGSARFSVDTTVDQIPTGKFFRRKGVLADRFSRWMNGTRIPLSILYTNDRYRQLLTCIEKNTYSILEREINEAAKEEYLLEAGIPGADLTQAQLDEIYNSHDSESEDHMDLVTAELDDNWAEGMRKLKPGVRVHNVSIPEIGASYERTIIHPYNLRTNGSGIWQVDNAVIDTLVYASEQLKVPVTKPFSIYSLSAHEDIDGKERKHYYSNIHRILGCGGVAFADGKTILLFETGREVSDESDQSYIKVLNEIDIFAARHETGHHIDPYRRWATSVQVEGFTYGIESGFNSDHAKYLIRKHAEHKHDISADQLRSILAVKPENHADPATGVFLAGALYSYIAEQLGPKGMMDWYGILTGGLDLRYKSESDSFEMEAHANERRDRRMYQYKGSLDQATQIAVHTPHTGNSRVKAQALINDFIQMINKK